MFDVCGKLVGLLFKILRETFLDEIRCEKGLGDFLGGFGFGGSFGNSFLVLSVH